MRHNLSKIDGQYSLTSAKRVGGTRKSRTQCIALTDCVCYDREGNIIRVIAKTAPTVSRIRTERTKTVVTSHARRDIMLQAMMGTIHDLG